MNNYLYNSDAYLREFDSDVISFKKSIFKNEEIYEFVLDQTCFFPEQGGQTSDTGSLLCSDTGTKFEVFHVSIKNGVISHLARLKGDPAGKDVKEPKCVHGTINWEERFDKMQNHSGEHLVSGTVHRFFGFDNVGFSLSDDNCTLDFNGTFSDEDIALIEKTVNRAVFENIEIQILYPDKEELASLEYRSKKEIEGQVRIVVFPGYDTCACCAPHVRRTGEIGLIKIVSAEHFKGGTRMSIRCGFRALDDYTGKLGECRKISQLLSVPMGEVSAAVEKVNTEVRNLKYDLIGKMNTILSLKAREVIKAKNPLVFIESADTNAVRAAVNSMIKENNGICGIFTGNDEKGYSFVIASSDIDCVGVLSLLKLEAGAKGGGNAGMIQGSIPCSENKIRALLKETDIRKV